jgi:diaminopimelate epimerase
LGLLDARVDVQTLGGRLTIEWAGSADALDAPVLMTGPATTVFQRALKFPTACRSARVPSANR